MKEKCQREHKECYSRLQEVTHLWSNWSLCSVEYLNNKLEHVNIVGVKLIEDFNLRRITGSVTWPIIDQFNNIHMKYDTLLPRENFLYAGRNERL